MKFTIHTTLLTIFCVLAGFSAVKAQGYRIEATIKGIKDTTMILGHYGRSNNQFVPKDTARADANGNDLL